MNQFPAFLQRVNLRRLAIIYALLQVISWLSIPEMSAYLSSIGFIVIPVLVGFALYTIFNFVRQTKELFSLDVVSLLKWWIVGLIALTVSGSVTSVIFPSFSIMVGVGFSVFSLLFCFIWGGKAETTVLLSKKSLLISSILAIGILIPFLYWRHISTFPYMLGDDLLSHLAGLSSIAQGIKGVSLVDDAFVLLIGIVSKIGGAQPLWLFWSGPLIQYAVMAVGIYLLSRKVTKSYYGSILAALLPLWFMGDGAINDLIFFLRRNVLMALVPFFILMLIYQTKNNEQKKSKPSKAFLFLLIIPVFYYFDVSSAIYNSTISKLSFVLRALLQPGFAFTSPSYTFGMPIAMSQFIYAFILSLIFLFVLIKFSNISERNDILSWALISFVSFMIDYRMGLMLSIIFYVFILLKKLHLNKLFFAINIVSIIVIILAFAGFDLSSNISIISQFVTQINGTFWSIQQKTSFLSVDYTGFYLYLTMFALIFLSFVQRKKAIKLSLMTLMASLGPSFLFVVPNRFGCALFNNLHSLNGFANSSRY